MQYKTLKMNFARPVDVFYDDDWVVWPMQPNDVHTWAFIFYCRDYGHKTYVGIYDKGIKVALKRTNKPFNR